LAAIEEEEETWEEEEEYRGPGRKKNTTRPLTDDEDNAASPAKRGMDLAGDGDDVASHGITDEGEEWNLEWG
jgi:hypothetical protein